MREIAATYLPEGKEGRTVTLIHVQMDNEGDLWGIAYDNIGELFVDKLEYFRVI